MTKPASLLQVRGLTLRFGGVTAVQGVDLDIAPGQVFSIIGPNGAGKTTVFNAITGLYEPTEGRILFEGRDIRRSFGIGTTVRVGLVSLATGLGLMLSTHLQALWDAAITYNYVYQEAFPWGKAVAGAWTYLAEQPLRWTLLPLLCGMLLGGAGALSVWHRSRRTPDVVASHRVGRTFQNIRLFPQMSVFENVLVGMETRLRSRLWDSALRLPFHHKEHRGTCEHARELLEFVGLSNRACDPAGSLCYGDQRRLEIARALAAQPKLLLLDEPAAGMNPSESVELMDLIRRIRERDITVLLIEHHMRVVMGISDRVAVLDDGCKIAEGTPDEVQRHPEVIKAYLGGAAS